MSDSPVSIESTLDKSLHLLDLLLFSLAWSAWFSLHDWLTHYNWLTWYDINDLLWLWLWCVEGRSSWGLTAESSLAFICSTMGLRWTYLLEDNPIAIRTVPASDVLMRWQRSLPIVMLPLVLLGLSNRCKSHASLIHWALCPIWVDWVAHSNRH